MPTIKRSSDFEPNKNALKLWLSTRKEEQYFGGRNTPGFFSTHNYNIDQFFFYLAFVLELVGVVLLISNGFSLGDSQFAIIAIIGAIGMFVADILFAYFLHRNHGKKCLWRNKEKTTDDDNERAILIKNLKKGKLGDAVLILGIVLIAIIKFLGIILLGTFDHLAIYISLFVMFAFIVYVHISHTGYFLYETFTSRAFSNQLDQFEEGDSEKAALIRDFYFEGDTNVFDDGKTELLSNQHKIIPATLKEGSTKKYAYKLITKGILIDEDITGFLQRGGLDKEQKTLIGGACLKHQLSIYEGKSKN